RDTAPVRYLGLFHGTAGIGLGLLAVYRAGGDEAFLLAARAAGDALIDAGRRPAGPGGPRRREWPRWESGEDGGLQALCHGAGGVGRYLVDLHRDAPGPDDLENCRAAAVTISSHNIVRPNPNLCHGAAGDVGLLLDLGATAHPARAAAGALERFADPERPGRYQGGDGQPLGPGLLDGLAGIAAAYLRLGATAQPDLVLPLRPAAPVTVDALGRLSG
ncbi:MAG TPA: lanthionine synthetase LanC family protein, partial [Acidimicrobiales bacterium]|nr:lanthionine synthetase LanC family protein [Acidimicrobiales bacterium]